MDQDYSKRGYLLPKGCKDLIDVLNKDQLAPKAVIGSAGRSALPSLIRGEVMIPDKATALQLAELLKKKPLQIIFDLMDVGVFAPITQPLDFASCSAVAGKYGYIAKPAG